MFYRTLLKAVTCQRYIVPSMCRNPSIRPPSLSQAYNANPSKWPNSKNRCRMLGQSIEGWHLAPLWYLHTSILAYGSVRGGCTVYWYDSFGTHYCDMRVSWDLNLSYTPTMINYLCFNCAWGCCILFRQCSSWEKVNFISTILTLVNFAEIGLSVSF